MKPISKLDIERYFTGELPETEIARVEQAMDNQPELKEYYQELQGDKNVFLAKHPYRDFIKGTQRRTVSPLTKVFQWFSVPRPVWIAVPLVLVLGVAYFFQQHPHLVHNDGPGIRYKSPVALDFLVRRNGEVQPGTTDDIYQAGDAVQFLYTANQFKYIALLSVDQSGKLSFYSPQNAASLPAKSGDSQPFPHSVELDAAPGGELFIALFTQQALSREEAAKTLGLSSPKDRSGIQQIRKRLQAGLPGETQAASLYLKKED